MFYNYDTNVYILLNKNNSKDNYIYTLTNFSIYIDIQHHRNSIFVYIFNYTLWKI